MGFSRSRVSISNGDRIFLFSDGLFEASNTKDQQYGMVRLQQAIDHTRSLPIQQSIDRILSRSETIVATDRLVRADLLDRPRWRSQISIISSESDACHPPAKALWLGLHSIQRHGVSHDHRDRPLVAFLVDPE